MFNGINNANILTDKGFIKGNIGIADGKITSLGNHQAMHPLTIDELVYIIPGFIDMHVHGVQGFDVMDGTVHAINTIGLYLTKEGTTSFLPTTMTQSNKAIKKALQAIDEAASLNTYSGAEILGIHLEGPFINAQAAGAQPANYVQTPSVKVFDDFNKTSNNRIKIVTLAPELDEHLTLTKHLNQLNIIPSIGHTKAAYQDVLNAIKAGAKSITHCYNAMTPLHHRDIGALGAALYHKDLHAELILDLIHVNKEAATILMNAKNCHHLSLITDSMRAKNLGDGTYDLGGQTATVKGLKATLKDGTLAGSVLPMIEAFKNVVHVLNYSLEEASRLASLNPAIQLGIDDKKGSLSVGKDADLVLLDKDLTILATICKGQVVYRRDNHEN
ncbi:N-acetylglucosamine-6-phosphate deacetylase [Liberiplasma polymorphum]|uniref:N-acetylglucosamine-6-phosphate deacetylase n=1 Tax=Liberiplasma polymorphum TaxID=3374570 RepID=UPI0037727D9D